MKTAVSLPDELFKEADSLAAEHGSSRSELYALALTEYLNRHKKDHIVDALNKVASKIDTSLEPDMRHASEQTIQRAEW